MPKWGKTCVDVSGERDDRGVRKVERGHDGKSLIIHHTQKTGEGCRKKDMKDKKRGHRRTVRSKRGGQWEEGEIRTGRNPDLNAGSRCGGKIKGKGGKPERRKET